MEDVLVGTNFTNVYTIWGLPGGSESKETVCNTKGPDSIPGLGRSPGDFPWRREWLPTPVSGLENSMGRGACQATVHGAAKSQT